MSFYDIFFIVPAAAAWLFIIYVIGMSVAFAIAAALGKDDDGFSKTVSKREK